MEKPPFEVADVIRSLADADGVVPDLRVSTAQQRVLGALAACRTAKLGGHVEACDSCDYERIAYNSCRNRHCPKCQARRRAAWLEARSHDLLPVPYFHVVFTLPSELAPMALQNQREIYNLLFSAAADTLTEIAANPRHLGAEIGFVAVLHTWGQTLVYHPHVHCVVPGGGLSPGRDGWIASRQDFFLPVRVVSRLFRGKFLARLRAKFDAGRLHLDGRLAELADPERFLSLCATLRDQEWVVYAKPPFGGPEQVLKYLARYTHRVAISNRRILNIDAGNVTFTYKDYLHGNRQSVMSLTAVEFLRRFVQHVLPGGFVRIRHLGFLANRCRRDKLARCRELLAEQPASVANQADVHIAQGDGQIAAKNSNPDGTQQHDHDIDCCPRCHHGKVRLIGTFGRQPTWTYSSSKLARRDSS